jgi:hypothetical protein
MKFEPYVSSIEFFRKFNKTTNIIGISSIIISPKIQFMFMIKNRKIQFD